MRNQSFRVLALGWAMLAGCEQAARKPGEYSTSPPTGAAPKTTAVPIAVEVARSPFTGYHRYRGTVGRLPVTVELTIGRKFPVIDHDSIAVEGRYYYHRRGQPLTLQAEHFSPRKPVLLHESEYLDYQNLTGRWQARQPLGPVLSGTWTSADGRRHLPFALHEDYQDAVRYEVLTEEAKGPICDSDRIGQVNGPNATLTRDYLHLLGPDTVQPGLRRLQCPVRRRRRAQLRRDARQLDCVYLTQNVWVGFNGNGLLTLTHGQAESWQNHPSYSGHETVYDLHTGRTLALADLLRPGTDSLLLQLIVPRLQRYLAEFYDQKNYQLEWEPQLPRGGFGLSSEGLLFNYYEGDGVASWPCVGQEVVVPYAELLPLLRPSSPLLPLLWERGLRPRS